MSCLGEIIHPSSRNLNFEIVSQPPVRQAIPMHMAPGISRTELYYRRPRGKRAGLKAKADESRRRFNIPVVLSSRPRYENSSLLRPANLNNLSFVQPKDKPARSQPPPTRHFVPSIMLSNPMSLQPKLSEVEEFLLRKNIQIGCIVESWLKPRISDTVVNIEGYNIVRKRTVSHTIMEEFAFT